MFLERDVRSLVVVASSKLLPSQRGSSRGDHMAKYLGKRRRADYMRACFALSFIILQTLDLGSGHGKPLSTEPLRDNLHQGALKSRRYKRGSRSWLCDAVSHCERTQPPRGHALVRIGGQVGMCNNSPGSHDGRALIE